MADPKVLAAEARQKAEKVVEELKKIEATGQIGNKALASQLAFQVYSAIESL